jgi:hypothetical protein
MAWKRSRVRIPYAPPFSCYNVDTMQEGFPRDENVDLPWTESDLTSEEDVAIDTLTADQPEKVQQILAARAEQLSHDS